MSVAREKLMAALRGALDEVGFRDDVIVPVQFLADVLEILEEETSSTAAAVPLPTSSTAAAVPLPLSGEGREDGARLLTVEELFALPFGSVAWEESRFLDGRPAGMNRFPWNEDPDSPRPMMRDDRGNGKGLAALVNIDGAPVYLHKEMLKAGHFDKGFQVRYWSAKPTPEQRRGTPWPEN